LSRASGGLLLLLAACETDDLGKRCGTEAAPVVDPVGDEVPVVEVVRLERDGECESFQCLTHRGLPPYCTRSCALDAPTLKQKSCSTDEQCEDGEFARGARGHCVGGKCVCEEHGECRAPFHCADGRCVDDDCPAGFWCDAVQPVGPLAGERLCVMREGCQTNANCEEFGVMECRKLGCYDACLRGFHRCEDRGRARCDELECFADCVRVAPDVVLCPYAAVLGESDEAAACRDANCLESCTPPPAECEFHRLVCEPILDSCHCDGAATPEEIADVGACPEERLVCQPDATAQPWPVRSVTKLNVCMPEDS
jgi:hypothetical protein